VHRDINLRASAKLRESHKTVICRFPKYHIELTFVSHIVDIRQSYVAILVSCAVGVRRTYKKRTLSRAAARTASYAFLMTLSQIPGTACHRPRTVIVRTVLLFMAGAHEIQSVSFSVLRLGSWVRPARTLGSAMWRVIHFKHLRIRRMNAGSMCSMADGKNSAYMKSRVLRPR
jgi:hypothetical protein